MSDSLLCEARDFVADELSQVVRRISSSSKRTRKTRVTVEVLRSQSFEACEG